MKTFLLLTTMLLAYIQLMAYVNYGHIITSKTIFITPLLFGFMGEAVVTAWKTVKENKEET